MNYSFSAISSFKSCPKSFEFKYLKRIPEAFQSIERHLGSCVHETLRWLYERRMKDKDSSFDQLKEQFDKFWNGKELKQARIVKQNTDLDDYYGIGTDQVCRFFQNVFQKDVSKTLSLEQKFEILLDDQIRYVGIIDRVARQTDSVIRITDFKTGKVDHPLDDLQLPSYALYILSETGDDKVEICFEDLRTQRTVVAEFGRNEINRVRSELLEEISILQKAKSFDPRPSVLCQWCGYNNVCENPHESVKTAVSEEELKLEGDSGESSGEEQKFCPECGGILKKRNGKFGPFLGCVNYPDCKYTLDIRDMKSSEDPLSDEREICPECGGVLRERKGKYGSFMGCSNYPECRFTRKIAEDG